MILFRGAIWIALAACCSQAQNTAVTENFKKAFNQRLQAMRIDGYPERHVLFQNVRMVSGNAGTYQFEVTALIHDYGAGYPRNRFYGMTCVSRMNQWPFTFAPDGRGGWDITGRFTVESGPDKQCKNNPSEGASSFPLASLQGTPAPTGQIAAAPAAPRGQGGVVAGSYECWSNGQARMMLNFTISGGGRYTDSGGKAGSYQFDAGTGRISFRGGLLDGVMPQGFYSIYYEPQGRPTVSFRNAGGSEVSFCQRVR